MHQISRRLAPLLLLLANLAAAEPVTPSKVYAEALYIGQQLELMERALGVYEHVHGQAHEYEDEHEAELTPLRMALKPRHSAQLSYELLFKINRLRELQGMPMVAVGALEPRLETEPLITYEQLRRIRTELDLLSARLGVDEAVPPIPEVGEKTPVDVYNLLRELSRHVDHLNADQLVPSQVFGEAMRIYHDVNTIVAVLRISDETIPPSKNDQATPAAAYRIGFELLREVQRLQRMADIPRTDFSEFEGRGETPADVFELTQLILAELQTVKAHLGMRNDFTPPARHYSGKSPGEIEQVLGWCRRKLWLIDNNNFFR